MDKKYQIFVSSTYVDLIEERQQVMRAILEMGHIPVGMEQFSAADEEQWKIIQRQIDQSDYYVVLIAHRYGSTIPGSGISYTEKEYDYALEKNIPTLGFVIDSSVKDWPHERYDDDLKKQKALEKFKKKVKNKPCGFWKSSNELHGMIAIALGKSFNTQPRIGWVRADSGVGPEVAEEIARLSKENHDMSESLKLINKDDNLINLNLNFPIFVTYQKEINYREFAEFNITILEILTSYRNNIFDPVNYTMPLSWLESLISNQLPKSIIQKISLIKIKDIMTLYSIIDRNDIEDEWHLTDYGRKILSKIPL
ncbi:DUF4062 domain-containing protein [Armatimonas rosea]|uniref:DUF4062 domain-containing protein n=1 Tax=Armatimonas rosea TaxID=685828 RepID=A0A7W9W897_ARMRO|nr:DUF4062 domain-containing protein [Armatimonas rosea]MBB6052533.1 hypothetical protein [Armatimonas rosea]